MVKAERYFRKVNEGPYSAGYINKDGSIRVGFGLPDLKEKNNWVVSWNGKIIKKNLKNKYSAKRYAKKIMERRH